MGAAFFVLCIELCCIVFFCLIFAHVFCAYFHSLAFLPAAVLSALLTTPAFTTRGTNPPPSRLDHLTRQRVLQQTPPTVTVLRQPLLKSVCCYTVSARCTTLLKIICFLVPFCLSLIHSLFSVILSCFPRDGWIFLLFSVFTTVSVVVVVVGVR